MTGERAGVLFTEIMQAVMSYPFEDSILNRMSVALNVSFQFNFISYILYHILERVQFKSYNHLNRTVRNTYMCLV